MTRPNFRKTNDRERTAKIGTKPEIELKFRGTKVGLALEHIVPSFKSDQVKGLKGLTKKLERSNKKFYFEKCP